MSSTCVLFETGAVECWGNNEYGQLGRGAALPPSLTAHPTPAPVVF